MDGAIEAELTKLLWRPAGRTPVAADFEAQDATAWADGADAIRHAMQADDAAPEIAVSPWLKVGETIYTPDQIKTLYEAQVAQGAGKDEPIPGDQPWE